MLIPNSQFILPPVNYTLISLKKHIQTESPREVTLGFRHQGWVGINKGETGRIFQEEGTAQG